VVRGVGGAGGGEVEGFGHSEVLHQWSW
jgi:hypothetical protein